MRFCRSGGLVDLLLSLEGGRGRASAASCTDSAEISSLAPLGVRWPLGCDPHHPASSVAFAP